MIRLGSLAGYPFEGPRLLAGWTPPAAAAVYAIAYKPDPEAKPDKYAVIYVGHADDLTAERFPFQHPRAHCWIKRAGSKCKVYICTYEAPGGNRSHREQIVRELTAIYQPRCNDQQFDQSWKDEWIGGTTASSPAWPRTPPARKAPEPRAVPCLMDHARLGRTGLQVSRLCLGTMTFGLQSDESTAVAILDRAAEGGIDFLDSSDAYPLGGDLSTRGVTEEILGRWLHGKRDRFIVATKCFAPTGPAPFDGGNSRKHIMSAVEASLRRLQTDYIDLYQLHGYDQNTPIDETLSALDDLVHQGKVRYTGCSNFLTYQIVRAVGRSETLGLARFDSVQPRYNLLFRQIEREMLPFCAEEGVGVIPYNPIAGGLLSGKHERSAPPGEGTRFTLGTAGGMYQQRYWHDTRVRHRRPARSARQAGRAQPGHDGGRLGAGQPGYHGSHHRRQPPRAARRQPGRRRPHPRRRPQAAARRAHPPVPHGRRPSLNWA